ncbi:Metallo-hydrolase/oxidoreductase [Ascodesmis nigricans]|uniref:Metallo-hydrolase/oxidoreductase n=1 Tax=Ascodesmis nigricans TaxID=341454 RepID=A0A4S2N8L9_9PEZI|nr:Metallo-hydrolase/oxidoreductase [Ascodesmis nigricans]
MATKRKLDSTVEEEIIDESDHLNFICLGGGNEVGRSCHIIEYKGKTVMLDAGQHPAYDGLAALPFFDEFDLSKVDVLLISHFHIDHAASLPYVMSKTNFKGRVFMTHPTKAIYKWLIQDSVRVGNVHNENTEPLYTEADHLSSYGRIEAIDYHSTITHQGISITPYHAGHVLGGAMFMVEIAGLKILFTGDYSREDDRHLVSAEVPPVKPDVLICESTYGTASHMPRLEKEARLMKVTTDVLNRGGRVLMPVFALGRAQELLLILDEYWEKHPHYQQYPIYYASNLARKCMDVYRTYINTMNDKIKRAMFEGEGRNPWDFRWIRSLKNIDRFEDVGGCVMLASPGMLQNGVSRQLLEKWAPDPKNGLIITGYSVEGTMAKQIMNEPTEIPAVMSANRFGSSRRDPDTQIKIPRRMSIEELSFAAHVDYGQNSGFIEEVGAKVVILVHGEQNNMGRLKSALLSKNHERPEKDRWKIYNPRNCEELRIPFSGIKLAKVVGKLARKPPPIPPTIPSAALTTIPPISKKPHIISGVLVQSDFKYALMAPDDLREYAGLTTTVVTCKQRVPMYAAGLDLIRWSLEGMFGAVVNLDDFEEEDNIPQSKQKQLPPVPEDDDDYDPEKALVGVEDVKSEDTATKKKFNGENGDHGESLGEEEDDNERLYGSKSKFSGKTFRIMDCVTVRCRQGYVEMEWEGNVLNDGIADAVLGILTGLESSRAAVRRSHSPHHHHDEKISTSDTENSALSKFLNTSPHAHITPQQRLQRVLMFLEAQFGDCVTPLEPSSTNLDQDMSETDLVRQGDVDVFKPGVEIVIDNLSAKVYFETLEVESKNEGLKRRVKSIVERAVETVAPFVDLVGDF